MARLSGELFDQLQNLGKKPHISSRKPIKDKEMRFHSGTCGSTIDKRRGKETRYVEENCAVKRAIFLLHKKQVLE
jgi:hypothetical protein